MWPLRYKDRPSDQLQQPLIENKLRSLLKREIEGGEGEGAVRGNLMDLSMTPLRARATMMMGQREIDCDLFRERRADADARTARRTGHSLRHETLTQHSTSETSSYNENGTVWTALYVQYLAKR